MKHLGLIFFIFISINSIAQNQILGKWLADDKVAITEIYNQKGKFYGKVVWLKEPKAANGTPITDVNNTDKALRNRAVFGLIILKDLIYKDKEWRDGTIYDPKTGKTYPCTLWLSDNNTLNVKGYWGILTETRIWTRAK